MKTIQTCRNPRWTWRHLPAGFSRADGTSESTEDSHSLLSDWFLGSPDQTQLAVLGSEKRFGRYLSTRHNLRAHCLEVELQFGLLFTSSPCTWFPMVPPTYSPVIIICILRPRRVSGQRFSWGKHWQNSDQGENTCELCWHQNHLDQKTLRQVKITALTLWTYCCRQSFRRPFLTSPPNQKVWQTERFLPAQH